MAEAGTEKISLAHGNGGKLTHDLIGSLFLSSFSASEDSLTQPLREMADSARLKLPSTDVVFTTDSHVVSPIFFPGADLGKLSVCGTLNDLAVMGARPLYLSCGLILEEGLEISVLRRVVQSMAQAARENNVQIVTGDTKVVEKGAVDQLFVNTSGIGVLLPGAPVANGFAHAEPGDAVIVTGTVGDHGIAVYAGREGIRLESELKSDCAAVFPLVQRALEASASIRIMRDPTRGGLATTLNEFVNQVGPSGKKLGIRLDESKVPVRPEVRGVCEILGFDPLYVANEGKLLLVIAGNDAPKVLEALRGHPLGRDSAIIGEVTERAPGRVFLTTLIGGERVLDMLVGDMLPRIC